MAVPATTDEFLNLVRRSGLITDEQLNSFAAQLQSEKAFPREPGVLAELVFPDIREFDARTP